MYGPDISLVIKFLIATSFVVPLSLTIIWLFGVLPQASGAQGIRHRPS
jgi:hypothetical protein